MTSKHRGPAHQSFNNIATQKQSFYTIFFPNLLIMILRNFFKKVINRKNDEKQFDNLPETNEENISDFSYI